MEIFLEEKRKNDSKHSDSSILEKRCLTCTSFFLLEVSYPKYDLAFLVSCTSCQNIISGFPGALRVIIVSHSTSQLQKYKPQR